MKANELMVGDWVYRPDCYDQVKETRQNGIIGLDSLRGLIGFSEIEPIPLTTEILEKNGFEDWDGWSIYSPENTGIEIAWLGTILKIGGECGNLELPAIEYVHQLQHALRLCGITREIIV